MGEHYFTADPQSQSREATAVWQHGGRDYTFVTDSGVFCRGHVDYGSKLLAESLPPLAGRVLDLGCGYGFLGIAAKLMNPAVDMVLCDINSRAVALARKNAQALGAAVEAVQSDGFTQVQGSFDFILCNPPVRAGKAVYYPWFEEAARRLNHGGALTIVLQRKQGAPSAQKRLEELFPHVELLERSAGYHIIAAYAAGSEG
jgi:16S rRNA (guanine1207-N2)-methyltransferase